MGLGRLCWREQVSAWGENSGLWNGYGGLSGGQGEETGQKAALYNPRRTKKPSGD